MNERKSILENRTARIGYLDSIRGIASVLVIWCHLACVFIPGLYFFEKANTPFEKTWLLTPLNVLTNGDAAVQCFFVLSGYLITRKIYLSKKAKRTPLSEYRKLLRVVIPGILLAVLLMVTGLMFHLQAADKNPMLDFVKDYNNFTPTVKSFIYDIFGRSFIDKSIYNGPFWTIKYEFFGALMVTLCALYCSDKKESSKYIYIFVGIILLAFVKPYYVSFIAGAYAYDCIEKEQEDSSIIGRITKLFLNNRVLRMVMLLAGIYLFCVNMTVNGIWKPIQCIPWIKEYPEMLRAVGIALLIMVVVKSMLLQKLLSFRPLIWLGRISAYTYAFHWPIILSVGCGVYLLLSDYLNYYVVVLIASAAVFIITLLLAYIFTIIVPKIVSAGNHLIQKIKEKFSKKKATESGV